MRKAATLLHSLIWLISLPAWGQSVQQKPTFEEYLRSLATTRAAIDEAVKTFCPGQYLWLSRWKRDPVLGYVEQDYEDWPPAVVPDGPWKWAGGIDGSGVVVKIQPNGARQSFMYADRKPRINTYGDSFTHGDQVNDGETWQEYLAAHLREPIGNFGTGGHGVYQAYRRMLREETGRNSAQYLILQVFGDASIRSLYRGRHPTGITLAASSLPVGKDYPIINTTTGHFEEKTNPLPDARAVYQLTDPDWIVQTNKDDLALELGLYERGLIRELDKESIDQLARVLDFTLDWSHPETYGAQATALLDRYANRASMYTLGKARVFAQTHGKKLFVILNDPFRAFQQMLDGKARYDQELLDYLKREKFDYFDMTEVHFRDWQDSKMSLDAYRKRYFIGHYNPAGNHFFAFAIKNSVVEWLEPKPYTYRLGIGDSDSSGSKHLMTTSNRRAVELFRSN